LDRARVLLAQGRPTDALEWLREQIATRPLNGELLRAAGLAALAADRADDAAASLAQALDLLGDGARTLELLVIALSAAGRHAEIGARHGAHDLLALPPAGLAAVGGAARLQGRPELAVSAFQRRVAARAGEAAAWRDLARAHFASGRY